ncbi:conserved oligomeric Golgi complex subunit 7 [Cydia strobilella]|uniref:conserved oligomeric Golgi complex subunit 7 n=1 Tax=Cydia strobilella TaxID=1100964 RepID=UPI00300729DA
MELKTFGEDDFDPKKWINRAWSSSGNQEKEVFVANTVSRLQLYMKQLTNSLDETTTQIVNSIPRTLQDAAALQLEGALLQQQLLSLEEKVEGVEEQTGHSILSLQRIDQLKSRLENAASALREADKWAALATALEDVLESGVPNKPEELEALAGQVTALTHSLEVLTEASDYESKRLQLEALYNRLEAALSAPFLTALNQGDKERTACYVSLFRGMNRATSAARCWRRSVCASLATQWRRSAGQPSPRIAALAGKGEAHTHVEWLTNVLKSETPYAELVRLYTDLLQSLDPSPTKVVSASLKLCSDPEEGILLLIELRRDIDEFIASIRAVIDEPGKNKEVVPTSTLQELGVAAYAPLKDLLPKYTDLQRQVFLAYLEGPQLRQDDILEQSRAILTVSERCEGWLDTAYGKAKKIAGDAAWPHYAPTVEAFFAALCALISSHSRRIEQEFHTSRGGVLSAACPAAVTLERAAAQALEAAGAGQPLTYDSEQPLHPLTDLPALLEADGRSPLPARRGGTGTGAGRGRAEPPASAAALRRAAQQLRALARAIVRGPVDNQLDTIPSLNVWSNNDALSTDLPDFSLSPQEYITEIGQYLMTLPQHLEMHLSEKQAPWQFLSEICTHTCEVYAEKILNIRNMDALGTKRCLTDIVYLSSVVEDLGTAVTPSLRNLERSLRAATPQHE